MSKYFDDVAIARETIDPVCVFIRNYDYLIRSLRTKFKSKVVNPNNTESQRLIEEELDYLIKIVNFNRLEEIPKYIVYNLLLLSRAVIKHYDDRNFKDKTDNRLEAIKEKHNTLANLPSIEAKLVRRK